MKIAYLALLFSFILLVGCEQIATSMTPSKKAIQSRSKLATNAEHYFWKTLHQGHYQEIPQAEKLLMEAYLKNPNDPSLAAHLGFLHIWKITEHQHDSGLNPMIPDEIILAKKYFSDAHTLMPNDAIFEGFYGDTQLVEGYIFQDKQEEVHGYFTLKRSIAKWPQFNYFTAGYVMSILPENSSKFKKALKWQWKSVDICAGRKVSRTKPDYFVNQLKDANDPKQKACVNTWVAPHNVEGFFMNMGDMLVKSGNWQTAIAIYQNAKFVPSYHSWPYRSMLEKRIKNAKENVAYFQRPFNFEQKTAADSDRTILFNSGHGCMACHQQS